MPFSLSKFSKSLKTAFSQLETSQAEALSIEIAANYIAGRTAGEKHNSFNTAAQKTAAYLPTACSTAGNLTAASQDEPADDEDELTTEEKAEIAILVAIALGYLHEYNKTAQAQILSTTKDIIKQAGGKVTDETKKEIKKRLDDVLEGRENVVIDNVGKTKKEVYVDKDLKLSEVEKVISKKYSASVNTYSELLGEQTSHMSYEAGRKSNLLTIGFNKWVFSGPADERARPWHVALLGEVYEYGSGQSEYAERCLREPRCRHRAQTYFGDSRDIPAEDWTKLKNDVGLYWNDKDKRWAMKEFEHLPKSPLTKVEKKNTKDQIVKRKPSEIKNIIKDHEAKIKNNNYETGILFDKNGNVLLNKKGKEAEVAFNQSEFKLFKGNILTHNHPGTLGGGSFSKEDIISACNTNLKEIRVVDNGATRIMKLKNGNDFSDDVLEKIIPVYEKHHENVINELVADVRRGKLTVEKAESIKQEKIWTRVAGEIDELDYKMILHEA